MIKRFLQVTGLPLLALAITHSPLYAQQPQLTPPAPPTELEQEQHRTAMLSAQLQVFADALRVSEAKRGQAERDAAGLAEWWRQYVAGLSGPQK